MHTRQTAFLFGLLAFPATTLARDVVWTHTWADELPLTVAEAQRIPGGIAVKTLDGSLVAVRPGLAPVAVSPYQNPILGQTTLLGLDSEGQVLLNNTGIGINDDSTLVRPGQWSFSSAPLTWQLAEGCARTLWNPQGFLQLNENGSVLPKPRLDFQVRGSAGTHFEQGCRLFGTNTHGQGMLYLTGIRQTQQLGYRPTQWIGAWGNNFFGGVGNAYVGQDSSGRSHYVLRSPAGSETAFPVDGENLGICLSGGFPLLLHLIVHERVGNQHQLRGFGSTTQNWTQPIPADAILSGCSLYQISEGIAQFRSINLDTGALGPSVPVIHNGAPCDVPVPSARLAVCNRVARNFTLGNSTISFDEPLRYAALSPRGRWVGPDATAPVAMFKLIERAGEFFGQIDFHSPFTGAIQSSTPEQPLGIPYDPSVRYSPVLQGPLDAGRWFVSLQRNRLDLTLQQIPIVFREHSPATQLRTSSGEIAEIDTFQVLNGKIAAIQRAFAPAVLLEWANADAAPRETVLGSTPLLSGISGDVVVVSDGDGAARRLRALRDGVEIWAYPIEGNCNTSIPSDGAVYTFCPVNEGTRTVFVSRRITIGSGLLEWTQLVASPNLNESSYGRFAVIGDGELRILGNGRRGSGPYMASYARLRQSDGTLISMQQSLADFSFVAVPDLPDGIAALVGSGLTNRGRYMIRARPQDGIQSLPIAEPSFELNGLLSNHGPRWYSNGRLLLRQTLRGQQRPFSIIPGQVGIVVEPVSTPLDGFQDYMIRLSGDIGADVGRIEVVIFGEIASVAGIPTGLRHGNPTRFEIPTPASNYSVIVRTVTSFTPPRQSSGWFNTSNISVFAAQPYRFAAGSVWAGGEANTGLRSGFEAPNE